MFEWIKKLMKEEKTEEINQDNRPLLVTIHGFGKRRRHEMDQLQEFLSDKNIELISFDMYDLTDEKDCDWQQWVKRAKAQLTQAQLSKRPIYLLGFSMGGVIASYLATCYPVVKLILIAPDFKHFHLENYTNMVIKGASGLISSSKNDGKEPSLPKSFYPAFMECVKQLKASIAKVSCPVLLIHGDADEVIPPRSSVWAFDMITHEQKQLIFLHLGKHRILNDEHVRDAAFLLIQDFIEDRLMPL